MMPAMPSILSLLTTARFHAAYVSVPCRTGMSCSDILVSFASSGIVTS